ncbi:uncharacterized protein LOC124944302 [Impatiens glandulifera]|uniref:uncharacterized protein LOC124944302 n=1 Tax=Impatiens glandulifera TaxID=253017 RepID=UPI001FB0C2CE|nr:uncharacterized protein LOC124944302 [Impatiens glandulifera]
MVTTQQFDNIEMRPRETMTGFDGRFSKIITTLSTLGKTYTNREIAIKVMRALPRECDVKTITMRESKDLNKMELFDLLDYLKAYEFEMNSRNEDEPSSSNVTMTLISSVEPTVLEPVKTAKQFSDDVMTIFAKKFGKFMKKSKPNNSYNYNYSNGNKASVRCFNCDTLGHYKSECRKSRRDDIKLTDQKPREDHQSTKHNKEIQKALLADDDVSKWAQSDSDIYNEEVRCFMENDEEVFDFASEEFTREDLITTLNDMVIEYKILSNLVSIQPDNQTIRTIELSFETEKLKETVKLLTKENERTKYVIVAWMKSGDVVSQMTSHQTPTNYESIIKREPKYVEPTNHSRWLSPERRKVSGSAGNERERDLKRHSQNHLSKHYESSKGKKGDIKPSAYRIIKTNTKRSIKDKHVKYLEDLEWYLDSGCSRHMTRNSKLLTDIVKESGSRITFGDNSKGKTMDKGKIVLVT